MEQENFIEIQRRLLALYMNTRTEPEPLQLDRIQSELSTIRESVRNNGSNTSLKAYTRFLTLIGKRVPSIAKDSTLALEPTDLAIIAATPTATTEKSSKPSEATRKLPSITATGKPGISLVTCCMNRNENLRKALASWLPHEEIDEIVIVDWSSDTPVREELRNRGIEDPRIRIIRVNREARWILSYAFNAGFRAAQHDQILKVDADIVLSRDFFRANRLKHRQFIAGNWRAAEKNQVFVNGFFFAPRGAIHAVGGFNEHITTYGWDDDDIYQRMTAAGFVRQDVFAGTVHHLDHSDEERLGSTAHQLTTSSALDSIMADTLYKIRRNRYIANVMPYWKAESHPVDFAVTADHQAGLVIQREDWVPSQVPPHIDRQADYIALWEIASWRRGKRIRWLEEPALRRLLAKPLDTITKLDIELSIAYPERAVDPGATHLVVRVQNLAAILKNSANSGTLAERLQKLADTMREARRALVIQAPIQCWPGSAAKTLTEYPLVPTWADVGQPQNIGWAQLDSVTGRSETELLTDFDEADLKGPVPFAPHVQSRRAKMFIDVQHGLGNRLRAMASAATIAQATDRELVVVWQPDDHCDCRLSDLFAYSGAVIDESFIHDASGCDIHNYMTIEGGEKNAPIRRNGSGDIYARSAFVLNSPHSDWARENRFLRSLRPVEAVQELVRSVRHPNDISAHVRMEGGRKDEHLPYESTANWTAEDHDLIDHWRAKSHFSNFMKRIDAIIAEGRAGRIFIAADKPETYEEFGRIYPDRIAWLQRSLYDRSAEQLQYALADAILLSRAPLMLGSTWSSFSELAQRLSIAGILVEMSGRDF